MELVPLGARYGRLVVIGYTRIPSRVKCRCDCGGEMLRWVAPLITGREPMCRECSLASGGTQQRWGGQRIRF
jgi:hypothetical protein